MKKITISVALLLSSISAKAQNEVYIEKDTLTMVNDIRSQSWVKKSNQSKFETKWVKYKSKKAYLYLYLLDNDVREVCFNNDCSLESSAIIRYELKYGDNYLTISNSVSAHGQVNDYKYEQEQDKKLKK